MEDFKFDSNLAKNNFNEKSGLKHASRGKLSVQKGAEFENNVADLYRLLGADVIQNIEICQKKVDILVTFRLPGSPLGHRIIVECKDEKKAISQNQRVMQFKGLLETARKSGEADSAEIITSVPWSDEAKGFARQSGIALLTYIEKIGQLIDFTTYLKDIIYRFEKGDPKRQNEPPLGAYYINLSAERYTEKGITERIPIIEDYIYKWISENAQHHLAILGEYGTGKSSLCQKLARDSAASFLKKPGSARIPILFNLREFTKTLKIESFVTSFLDEECGVQNPRFRLFQVMNNAGMFLLIFDGFDEMAVRVDRDTLEINLQEIEKLSASPKSKVIITSRLEYFVSSEEEKKSLSPKRDLLSTREKEYYPLKIAPWNDEHINEFLKKRVPLINGVKQPWTFYHDSIKEIEGLSDLSRRPVLLDMITKTLPQLITSGKPINRSNLYETYLLGEIKRQKILKHRTLLLSEASRFSLLQHLALDFYIGEILAITFSDALEHIEEVIEPNKSELEALTRDFLTCSFLIRKGDEYRFSHRSIMEYLIAKGLIEEIEKKEPTAFKLKRLDIVVSGFLKELNPNRQTLWNWILLTRSGKIEDSKYLGGNAATLLCELEKNALKEKDLSGTNLLGADLRNANLSGTLLKDVNLSNAWFFKKDFQSAIVHNVTTSIYFSGNLIKMGSKKNEFFNDLTDQLKLENIQINKIEMETIGKYGEQIYRYRGKAIVTFPNINGLKSIFRKFIAQPWIDRVTIYHDEWFPFNRFIDEHKVEWDIIQQNI